MPLTKVFFNFLTFVQIITFTLTDLDSECRSIEYLQNHPLECCSYPQFSDYSPMTANKCAQTCRNDVQYSSFSCQRICIIKETGVIDGNGNIDVFTVIKFFYDSPKDLSPKWEPTVRNSIKNCEYEFPKTIDLGNENQLSFCYKNFIECIRKMNFINCPYFNSSGDCGKMKELMTKCERKNYDFLHKILFEEIYTRGNWKPEITITTSGAMASEITTGKIVDNNKITSTTSKQSSSNATTTTTSINSTSTTIKSSSNNTKTSKTSSNPKQTNKVENSDQFITTVASWSTSVGNFNQKTAKSKNNKL
ncbi:hypothetical protein PVAND_016029 [Polypedilum vanderplanki]|uniref:Uncharacterized protein n=1 Tax=Polypedilum vanderplanki TaxID=319348 RepID=A0A9J6BEE6_POLVA|nr:hypothetical protein PVAND_016029 [Polypedilum vanderplanki]